MLPKEYGIDRPESEMTNPIYKAPQPIQIQAPDQNLP